MNIALWIAQILLALAFAAAGFFKLATPIDELLANGMTYVEHLPDVLVRFIGLSEVLGALGLILPAATRIKPVLTPLAALGLVVVMVLAAATHAMLGEFPAIGANAVLGGLAAFVVWGRTKRAPISPR